MSWPRRERNVLIAYSLFFLLHLSTVNLISTLAKFPTGIDELQHLSYIYHVKRHPEWIPDYTRMYLIDLEKPDTFTEKRNWLWHPSFYYQALKVLVDPGKVPLDDAVSRLRRVNMAISGLAVAFLLAFGLRYLAGPEETIVFAAAITMIPKMGVMGGMINVDNLAILGGAITLFGLARFLKGNISLSTAALVGSGFAIGGLSKLSAGGMLGMWILFCHLPSAARFLKFERKDVAYLLCLLAFAAVGVSPYVGNLFVHGTPLFIDPSVYPMRDDILGLAEYTVRFLGALMASWSPFVFDSIDMIALFSLLGLSVFGTWRALSPGGAPGRRPLGILIAAGFASIVLGIGLNIWVTYELHLATGFMPKVFLRFYLPLWGGIAAGTALGIGALATPARRVAATGAVLALLLYSHTVTLAADVLVTHGG